MKQKRAKAGKKIPSTPGFEPHAGNLMFSQGHTQLSGMDFLPET